MEEQVTFLEGPLPHLSMFQDACLYSCEYQGKSYISTIVNHMLVQSTIKIEYSEVSSSKEEKQIQHYEGEAFLTVLEEKYEGEKTKRCRRSEEFENKKVLKLKTEKFIIKKFPTKHGVRVTKFKFKDKNLGPKIKKAELKSKQKDFL